MFNSDPNNPSFETKRTLSPQQADESQFPGGKILPFTIALPPDLVSSSSSSVGSTTGHQSSNGHSTGGELKYELIVTIYRRGPLTRNAWSVVSVLYSDGFSYYLHRIQGEAKNLLRSASGAAAAVIPRSDLSQPSRCCSSPSPINVIMATTKLPGGNREGCHIRPG